jgi:hypothetical protein
MEKLKNWCKIKLILILGLGLFINFNTLAFNDICSIEKKRALTISFDLSSKDKIKIDNKFGDVKVKFWDKKMVKVEVLIIANAPTESKVKDFLEMVNIESNKENSIVQFTTIIDCDSYSYNNNISWGNNKEDKNQVEVNYLVYMPNENDLNIKNSFGDIYVPEFLSELVIKQNYGTLFAEKILNSSSSISINYGKAYIKKFEGQNLSSNYSTLIIDEAKNTNISNKYGKININNVENVDGVISYSTGSFSGLKNKINLNISYSNDFKLGKIEDAVSELMIKNNYSNLRFPVNDKLNFDFDIKMNHSKLEVNSEKIENLLEEIKVNHNKYGNSKTFKSLPNKNQNKTKIVIVSNFGDIEFN